MEIAVGGGGGERLYSQNLRDFLSIKEEDHLRNLNNQSTSSSSGGRRSSSGLTLSAILGDKFGQPPPVGEPLRRVESNRTLLDIIREDETTQTTGLGRAREDNRRSWRQLKDKIRLRRRGGGGSAWPVGESIPLSDVNSNNNHHQTVTAMQNHSFRFNSNTDSGESTQPDSRAPIPFRNPRHSTESASGRFPQTSSSPRRRSTTDDSRGNDERRGDAAASMTTAAAMTNAAAAEGDVSPEQPVRMSLMALLAENDQQMGYDSPAFVMDEDKTTEGVAEEETGTSTSTVTVAGKGAEYDNCCVCMVRHKGAAFIPCGHTFCRLCSRELWVQRGNCPLCNNFILEVLDIF